MDWPIVLALFMGSLLLLLILRVPVAIALLAVNIVGAILLFGFAQAPQQIATGLISSVTNYSYSAVPLFILMGEIIYRSSIAQRAIDSVDVVLGKLPGRQAVLATSSGTLFGVLSGSTIANTAMLGRLLLPGMLEKGYSKTLSMGSIMGAGALAMILPPSALAVVWGATAQVPIGPLFIAGIIPGLLLAVIYVLVILVWATFFRGAPSERGTLRQVGSRWLPVVKNVMPLGIIIFAVIGFIFLGIATPTESAATGVVGSLLVAAIYRSLKLRSLWEALVGTVKTTTMIFFLLFGSQLYSQVMSYSGASTGLVEWALGASLPAIGVLLIMIFLVLLFGLFLDQVSIMLITIPLFMPIVAAQGWDPVTFGIIMLIALEVGLLTPPFGLSLFVMRGVAPEGINMVHIYKAAAPFVVINLVVIGALIAFPELTLWLPSQMDR